MTVPLKTRVLLADDHAIVRRGLRLVLDAEPDLRSSPRPTTAPRRSSARCASDVDLAVLDVSMPRMTGPPGGARARRSAARRPGC